MAERRLRIALTVHDCTLTTGHGRYVIELARRLAPRHDVHVGANAWDEGSVPGATFHRIPAVRVNALAASLSFLPGGTRFARGRYDIVHAQGLCGFGHNVITAHICQVAWSDAQRAAAGRLTGRQQVTRALIAPLERAAFRGLAGAPRVIAISQKIAADLQAAYGVREPPTVIPHGVDCERFAPAAGGEARRAVRAEAGLGERDFVLLGVGDLQKFAPLALEALAQLPDLAAARLLLVSASDPAPYRALARTLGVEARVAFLPRRADIERCYAAADVFLFPTFYDAFGMVVLEAMACGLPVVTGTGAGAAELIRHGQNGLVARSRDASEYAALVRRLHADPDHARALGRAARRTAETHTWDLVAAATERVYREVAP